jgi:hypothetical protein
MELHPARHKARKARKIEPCGVLKGKNTTISDYDKPEMEVVQ